MKPVFQKPMDGQCVRASICSIFELPIEAGPRVQCDGHTYDAEQKQFICTIPEHKQVSYWTANDGTKRESVRYDCNDATKQDAWVQEWLSQFGLRLRTARVNLYAGRFELEGRIPAGLCIAVGDSPRFRGTHAVVWDTRLSDFEHPLGRMVHDPAPVPEGTRPGLSSLESFDYFEVEDPSLLHKFAELRTKYAESQSSGNADTE